MKTAVFLMNLGGPRSLAEVEPYLYELFLDVLPRGLGPLRRPLAWLIANRRAPSSAEKYQLIGGRSPLVERTEEQARALAAALGPDYSCHLAMRCGHPATGEAVREALAAGAERALALPLYPQWANATTRSSLAELRRVWPGEKPLVEVCTWHDHPGWLEACAGTVRDALAELPEGARAEALVIFSAHGLPLSEVEKGDPYPQYVEASARGVAERCGLPADRWQVTYQSRIGPTKWLGPDTVEFLRRGARGRAVVTVPVAFVSEHLETLYDLDILAREAAAEGGAVAYARAKAVGTRPEFVAALAEIARAALAAPQRAA
ncbi:ferrochelatase [Anaeromyxobacter diazotrophicus]|uniref:Ferrochelatase n=1 Tax=Anaeromyxobacter diazotrophicus TaxID=2590199 RepID=A0A7I9VRN3_9BACT|nr:ferrochelatase [Anaeromyxobacter diazotrophicus]GEJ58729.1 ferrochelatase [Anaeromyxobacter diazotrophicus]